MNHLLWMDLEMTGLDVDQEVIIEVAAIITDKSFKEITNYHAIVNQPQVYLDNMDEWNTTHHGASGLLKEIPKGLKPSQVEQELIEFCEPYFEKEGAIICGNTIGQDKIFLRRYFKKFSEYLHYRQLDVTAWKLIFNNMFDITFEKESNHRALDDVRESIEELKYYMQFISKEPLID